MSSIWLEVRKALLADAERARSGARSEAPIEERDGVAQRAHVHDHLHDEMRAFERIRGRERGRAYYPDEGKAPADGRDGSRPWRRGAGVRDAAEGESR
jgi:hypothetical protein